MTQSFAFSSMAGNQNQSISSMSKILSPSQPNRNPHQLFSQGGERKLEKRTVAHHNLLSSQRKQRENYVLDQLRTEPISRLGL